MNEDDVRALRVGDEDPVRVRNLLEISDKIAEARFFLQQMEEEPRLPQFRWLTSACLGACRAALDWLAWNACHCKELSEGGCGPDEQVILKLSPYVKVICRGGGSKAYATPVHSLLATMSDLRQETGHRSPLWIQRSPARQGETFGKPSEQFVIVHSDLNKHSLFGGLPGPRAIPFLREVLDVIECAQSDVEGVM